MSIKAIERELLRGVAPMAVMQLLAVRPMYGYELVRQLAQHSSDVLSLGQGTLYPLLYNLEAKKLVRARESEAPSGRVRRYYELTALGKKRLADQRKQWDALRGAMDGIIDAAENGGAV